MIIESYNPQTANEIIVLEIYHKLLDAWNKKDSHAFAHLFSGTSYLVGFDGSQMIGQAQIEADLKNLFANHSTGMYKAKVRDIRHLDNHCMLLFAVAGIVPAGASAVDPSKNAVQMLIACKSDEGWFIDLFQNTPAQYHQKPELAGELTDELMQTS